MVEYFDDGHFIWKIEGNVLTMQRQKPEAFAGCADTKKLKDILKIKHEKTNENIEKAKKRGIAIIEFWVDPRALEDITDFHKKAGRKLEVLRTEKHGELFCRLLL